jgi:hypothetical protein
MSQSLAQRARNRLGGAARNGTPEQVAEARRELVAAGLEDHIRRIVDAAPPLTPAQRERLALLLCPNGAG